MPDEDLISATVFKIFYVFIKYAITIVDGFYSQKPESGYEEKLNTSFFSPTQDQI